MANRLAGSTGKLQRFGKTGQVTTNLPTPVADSGSGYTAAARMFAGLAGELGRLADAAAMREGAAAGREAGRGAALAVKRSGSVAPSQAESRAMRFFLDHGLSRVQAAGIVGNLKAESALSPLAVNKSSGAFGLAQWLGARKKALHDFARAHGADPADFDTQLGFYLHEMKTTEGRAWKMLQGARTVEDAAMAGAAFERAEGFRWDNPRGIAGWKHRLSHAQRLAGGGVDLSVGSSRPLALRRDGTLRGEAHDRAARDTVAWRDGLAITEAVSAAWEEHKDDPAALAAKLDGLKADMLKNVNDPHRREALAAAFDKRSLTYRMKAESDAAVRAEAGRRSAARRALDADAADIEKQAYLAGASPGGGQIVMGLLGDHLARIDRAEEDGAFSPAEAAARRKAVTNAVAGGHVRGVFDSLKTLEEKGAFAAGLMKQWARGEGALAKMAREDVESLVHGMELDLRRQAAAARSTAAMKKAEIRRLAATDVDSVSKNGTGLVERGGLDVNDLRVALSPKEFKEWSRARIVAGKVYFYTHDLPGLPESAIAARLADLDSVKGGVLARRIRNEVSSRARTILARRKADPAAAVEEAFEDVRNAARAAHDGGDGASHEALVRARLAAQSALDIPEAARQPLTNGEALALARSLDGAGNAPGEALMELAERLDKRYGEYAPVVFAQVLRVQGVDRAQAGAGSVMLRRLRAGVRPSTGTGAAMDSLGDAGNGDAAFASPTPPPLKVRPAWEAIYRLRNHPETAAGFDAKYGAGAAEFYLRTDDRPEPPVRIEDDGIVTTGPDGESYRALPWADRRGAAGEKAARANNKPGGGNIRHGSKAGAAMPDSASMRRPAPAGPGYIPPDHDPAIRARRRQDKGR